MSESLDAIAPSFRVAKERWPDAPNLQAHYADLSRTFEENGSSLLELCKSFVETVCITVVNELGGSLPANGSPSTTEYLGAALDALGLRNERGASALGKVVSGHNKLADGLTDVRNYEGSVAHGKDGFLDAISDRHARVYLLSADTILSLVLSAYETVEPSILHTRESHARYKHHNKRIDLATAISAEVDDDGILVFKVRAGEQQVGEGIDLRVPTSELLYYLDRQAYIDVLNVLSGVSPVDETETDAPDTDVETETEQPITEAEPEQKAVAASRFPGGELLRERTEYYGHYADKASSLYDYIIHSLLNGNSAQTAQVQNFTYTLLNGMENLAVVDWSKRESTRSAVRLFVKKLVSLFPIEGLGRESIEDLVEWLAKHVDGSQG